MDLDMTSEFSLSEKGADGITAGSNYYLPVYDHKNDNIDSLIWMFDSHDWGCDGVNKGWGCVEREQIDWFNKKYEEVK